MTDTKWQPIETAPRDETDVLLASKETDTIIVAAYCTDPTPMWHTLDGPAYQERAFSHWMPLPSHPAKSDASK